MPFVFSETATRALAVAARSIEDRRDNPVRGRDTTFRLSQQNMLSYTFPNFVPGFGEAGVNRLPFDQIVERPTANARREGVALYGDDFKVEGNAVAKVEGDIFETVEAAVHWNAVARWNAFMTGGEWPTAPRYPRPSIDRRPSRQLAVLSLPRRYDWVRLLAPEARAVVDDLRADLAQHDLSLPTSTPDLLVVVLPEDYRNEERWRVELPDLGPASQRLLSQAHKDLEGRVEAGEFILAIALKKSLRSDRLYQPLYEANIMQLLLEKRLGAPQVDFEVHTLQSAGTAAITTYKSASLAAVAGGDAEMHRAVRDLYEPASADQLVRRFLGFLGQRMDRVP